MSRSTDFTSIYRSIDSLATKFSELEDAYYDHLQKSQRENEAILAKQIDFSSEDYKGAVKEQTYIQNSAKQLTTIEKAYKTEVNQLKSSLQSFREEKANVPKNIIKELQRNIENSIKGLKQSVFSLDAVKNVEQRVGHKIQRYFEDTFQTVGQLFAEVPQISKSHVQDVLGLSEIEDLCRRNTEAIQNLESDMDAFQRITNSSFREIDKLARNLNDEHSSMQVNIEQTKEEVIRVLQTMRVPHKKSASEIDNNIPSILDHILGEAIVIEGKMNKIFANIKTHADDISKSVKQHLKNNKKQLGALRTNNEILQSDLNMLTQNQYEAKVNIVSHSSGNTEDENKRTRKIQKLRVQTHISPMSNRRHTPRESKDEKTSTTRSFASISPRDAKEQFFLNTTREKYSTSQHELEINSTLLRDMQTLLETHMNSLKQKFDIFKNTAKSFVSSSGKVLKLVAKKGSEEEFTTKVYENDKKLFDTHLNALEGVINQGREKFDNLNEVINPSNPNSPTTRTTKTQSAKYSPKDITHTKSPVSNSKKKSATKKKNTDRYRIQTLIQDFENKHGDLLKSPRDINASSRFEQQESLSAAVSRTMTVSKSQPDMSPGLKSGEFELILLQKRCEELDKERERMKDEVDHMKKQPIASELIPKLQALNDHNEKLSKDNAKLVKVAKKLENKASERKETIRKLYDMISEKEREINLYKNNNSSVLPQFVKQMETSIYQVESEMIIKYEKLRKDLQSKEKEISNLEELFSRFRQHSFVSKKSLPFSDFDPSRHPERYENEKGSIREVNKDDLAILDQKRAQLEEVLSQVLSISHVPKLKSVINFLEEEKADINEKIKNSRSLLLEQINMSRDSKEYINEKKSLRESMKDPEDFRQKASILQAQVFGLEVDKKDLEERCSDLVNELEAAQKLRKTNERNYQDEVRVLNNKIQQLNDHIEEIETRTNEKLRSSLTGDKAKRFYSPGRLEISPTYHSSMDDIAQKDLNRQLQNEIKAIEARIKQMIENTGAANDNYNLLSTIEKLERLESAFKQREENLLGKLKDVSMREGELRVSEKNKVDASKLEEVNKNNAELQKMIDIYKKSVAESNEDNKKLSGIIETKNQEIEALTKAVQERTNDNQALVDELKSLQEGVEKCESQYQEHIERLANVLLNYGLPVDSTETDLVIFGDNLVDLIDSTLEIVAKIKADFEEKTVTSVEEKEEAREHIKKLEEENQELLDALEEMKGDLEKKDAEIEEVTEEKLNIEQQLEILKKNAEKLEGEFNLIKGNKDLVNEKERVIKEQQKKIGEMKSEYMRKVEEMNNNFWKETEQYNFKIQNQSKQNAKLKELLQNTANELTETKAQLAKGNSVIKELEESIQGKDSEIVSLQRNLDNMIMSIPPKSVVNEEKLMLEKQLEDYHSDLVEKEAYIEGLENDYKRQEQKLIIKEEEVDKLEEKIEELKSSIETLTASNAELKEDTVRLEQENLEQKNAMIQNIDNLVSDRDFLSIEINNLKENVQQQSTKLQEKESEIRRITQVSERAQSELKEAIAKKDEEISILDKEFNILKSAILTTNETVHNLELEQERLKGLIVDLEHMNKELTEERDNLLIKIDTLVKESNEEKERLEAEISQYKSDLESAVKRIHEYEETAGHDKQRHEESIKAYEQRIQELQNIIHEKDQLLENRIKEMSTGENEIQELQLKVSRHESKHIDLENNILNLNSRIQKYESENETLDKLAKNLETETENLKNSLKSNENELKNAEFKSQELESQISQANLKINELEGQIADRQGQIEQLTAKLEFSDKEKSRLQEILTEKEDELRIKMDHLEELHDKKKELEVRSSAYNENLAEFDQKTNLLVKELSEAKEENQVHRQQIEKKEEEIQGLTVLLSQKEGELQEVKVAKEELENVIGEMRVKQTENESELESLKVQVTALERAVSVMNDKNNALNEENIQKENELEDLRIKVDANKEDHYREEVQRLENELNELRTSFVEKENEVEEKRVQKEKEHLEAIQNLQISVFEKEELSKQMTQRIETLETNLKEILLENGRLRSKVEEENKKALNENASEIERLNTKIIELENVVESSRQSETTIKEEFVELQTQSQDLAQSIALKEKEIETLKDTLRENEARHKESSEKELHLSNSRLQEVEQELDSIKTLNEDLMAKVLNYDEEFRTLKASVVDKEQELLDLQSTVQEKEKTIAAHEEKIRASEDQAAKIKEAADTNEKGIEQMRLENAKYEVELQTANSKINEVEMEMSNLNNELREQKRVHDEEYAKISTSLKEKENELFSVQRDLEAKENDIQSLQEEIIARESEINEAKEKTYTREKELDELKLEKAKYQDEMEKLEEELQKVKDLTTSLVAKIQNYDETSQTLNVTLQEKDNTIAHIQTDLENRNKEIETLQGEISVSQGQVLQLNEKLNANKTEIEEMGRENSGLKSEVDTVRQQLEGLNTTLAEKERENVSYKQALTEEKATEADNFKRQLFEIENQLTNSKEKASSLEAEVQKEKEDNSSMRTQLGTMQAKIQAFEKTIAELEKVNLNDKEIVNQNTVEIEDLTAKLTSSQEELSSANTKISELETEIQDLAKECEKLREDVQSKSDQNSNVLSQLMQKEKEFFDLRTEFDALSAELNQKTSHQEGQTETTSQETTKLQEELEVLKKEINELKEANERKEEEISQQATYIAQKEYAFQHEIGDLADENDRLRKEMEEREEQYNDDMREFSNALFEIKQAVTDKDEELGHRDHEIEQLRLKLEDYEKKLLSPDRKHGRNSAKSSHQDRPRTFDDLELEDKEKIAAKCEKLETEKKSRASPIAGPQIEKLEKELEEAREALQNKTTEFAEVKANSVVEIGRVRLEYQEHINQLNDENEALKERSRGLIQEYEDLQADYDSLKSTKDLLQLENSHLTNEIGELNKKVDSCKDQIRELREKRDQLTTKLKEIDLGIGSPVAASGSEKKKKKKKKHDQDQGQDNQEDDVEQMKANITEYERQIEKLKKERKDVMESHINLKDENKQLRQTMQIFQEQIVMLNQNKKSDNSPMKPKKETNVQHSEIVDAIEEGLGSLRFLKPFQGRIDSRIEDGNGVKRLFEQIKTAVNNYQNLLSRAAQSSVDSLQVQRAKMDYDYNIQSLTNTMIQKLFLIKTEVINIVRECEIEAPSFGQDPLARKDLNHEEEIIYSSLNLIKKHLKHLEGMNSQQKLWENTELDRDQSLKIESDVPSKGPMIPSIQLPLINLKSASPVKRETEEEKHPAGFYTSRRRESQNEQSSSIQEDLEDIKGRSFLKESYDLDKMPEEKDEGQTIQQKNQMQALYIQIRMLQDENEKLELEYKQLKNDFESLKFLNEDLQAELQDKDERIKKMVESVMGPGGGARSEEEKEHLKGIFLRFLDSALQGLKEAEDLLRVLLTLLAIPEQERNQLIAGFKAKTAAKKGIFSKIFK